MGGAVGCENDGDLAVPFFLVLPGFPGKAGWNFETKYSALRTRLARPQVAVPTAQANDDPVLCSVVPVGR